MRAARDRTNARAVEGSPSSGRRGDTRNPVAQQQQRPPGEEEMPAIHTRRQQASARNSWAPRQQPGGRRQEDIDARRPLEWRDTVRIAFRWGTTEAWPAGLRPKPAWWSEEEPGAGMCTGGRRAVVAVFCDHIARQEEEFLEARPGIGARPPDPPANCRSPHRWGNRR